MTIVEKVVDLGNSPGTNYTTWDAYENAYGGTPAGDLVPTETIAKCVMRCSNGAAYPYFYWDGWASSSETYHCWIYVPPEYRHPGYWVDSGNVVRVNSYTGIYNLSVYDVGTAWRCDGVAFRNTNRPTTTYGMHFLQSLPWARFERCVFDGGNLAGHTGHSVYGESCFLFATASVAIDFECDDCVFSQWDVYDGVYATKLHYISSYYRQSYERYRNCVFDGFQAGMVSDSSGSLWSTVDFQNCAFWNMPAILGNAMVYGTETEFNAWDGAPFGTDFVDIGGYTVDEVFTDRPASDYSLPEGSPLRLTGVNLYAAGVVDDVVGTARPASGPFDVGAYQSSPAYSSATGAVVGPEPSATGQLSRTVFCYGAVSGPESDLVALAARGLQCLGTATGPVPIAHGHARGSGNGFTGRLFPRDDQVTSWKRTTTPAAFRRTSLPLRIFPVQ